MGEERACPGADERAMPRGKEEERKVKNETSYCPRWRAAIKTS